MGLLTIAARLLILPLCASIFTNINVKAMSPHLNAATSTSATTPITDTLAYKFLMEFHDMQESQYHLDNSRQDSHDIHHHQHQHQLQQQTQYQVKQQSQQSMRETELQIQTQVTTPQYFIETCENFLLGDEQLGDNYIATDDAANFFEFLCDLFNLETEICFNEEIPFHSLQISIQFAFIHFVCPDDVETLEEDQECIDILRAQARERETFGLVITDVEMTVVQDKVTAFCSNVYQYATDFHLGTLAPTKSPAPSATPTISMEPTISTHPSLSNVPSIAPFASSIQPTTSYQPSSLLGKKGGTESPKPSSVPSSSPAPTDVPSPPPTATPSVSLAPTSSPSDAPSAATTYAVVFTFVMGFDDANVHQGVIDGNRKDILSNTRTAIQTVLQESRISRRYLRRGRNGRDDSSIISGISDSDIRRALGLSLAQADGSIQNKVTQNTACPSDFTLSTDCILIATEVTVTAAGDDFFSSKAEIESKVRTPIKESMDNKSFKDKIENVEVKEVKYLLDGPPPPVPNENPIGVGGGSIAGITIGSVLLLVAIAFFVGRVRAKTRDRDNEISEENELASVSDFYVDEDEEGSLTDVDADENNKNELSAIEENEVSQTKSRGMQFDTVTGAAVGSVAMSYASASSFNSDTSGYSADDPESQAKAIEEGDVLVDKLDAAVHAGDWAAVAAIAGDLSQADDISTMSSFYSKTGDVSYDPSERDNLKPGDAKRAAKIDKLIADGDWNAVGATAAAFSSEASSSSSGSSESRKSGSSKDNATDTRRSLLNFIQGPWQSKAAAEAVNNEDENDEAAPISAEPDVEAPEEEDTHEEEDAPMGSVNANEEMSESEASDLTPGIVPSEGQSNAPSDALVGLGTIGATGALAAAAYHGSESDTTATDDDAKQLLNASSKKKRGWAGLFSLRRKSDKQEEVVTRSLALQEDSSVSSWSRGEDSSPDIYRNIYGEAQSGNEIPPEMETFGENLGLAAAEDALYADKGESDGGLSAKSSNSLRDELDKAIESGDWAAVEKQTNEMLEAGVDDDSPVAAFPPDDKSTISDVDSDVDTTNDREVWSADNKSDDGSDDIDDERISMLEELIETDDWQGIVDNARIHTKDESVIIEDNA